MANLEGLAKAESSGMLGCARKCDGSQKCTSQWKFMQGSSLPGFSCLRRGRLLQKSWRVPRCSQTKVTPSESNNKSKVSSMDKTNMFDNMLTPLPLVEFKMSDFELSMNVSIGLAGRGDEIVYEAIVRNPDSHMKGSKVVLRQLAGPRAQRWGKHGVQVITKLVRRMELYQSYATQIYGYILPCDVKENVLTLVHGYYDNYSLHHWLLCEDWVPTLESRLALDKECGRRVGDDRIGGPAVSRQLRLIQILMRDILIGVNYLHSHGFAHTDLRLQNVQISEVDRHIKVGLLGNASHFEENSEQQVKRSDGKKVDRRQLMIAYDIRCVGIMMAKMVLKELMDTEIFEQFKSYLNKGNDPAGLREFLVPLLCRKSSISNPGLQIFDRNGGAGWNLLSLMLASKALDRVSCTEALRHRFLCGPKWRVESSVNMTRWSIGSSSVRIVEEYIYGYQQRTRLAQLIHVLELLNPNTSVESWSELLPGKWRLVYHTGRQIGLTWRQGSPAVLIGDVFCTFYGTEGRISMASDVKFTAMHDKGDWLPDKSGTRGHLKVASANIGLRDGERRYSSTDFQSEAEDDEGGLPSRLVEGLYNQLKGRGSQYSSEAKYHQSIPEVSRSSVPIIRLDIEDIDMSVELDYTGKDASYPLRALQEVRVQIPAESFDISKIVCGTYIDARLLVLRGVSGAALFFLRSGGS